MLDFYSIVGGMLLYSGLHNMFALQYLRAGLTVPLHFERRRRQDSNYEQMLPELDRKIKIRITTIAVAQTTVMLFCTAFIGFYFYPEA